jgi:hypothetical protein
MFVRHIENWLVHERVQVNIFWRHQQNFVDYGYVGVMTRAEDPPQWLREQRLRDQANPRHADKPDWWKQGIGCEFGAEIALEQPAPRLVKTA